MTNAFEPTTLSVQAIRDYQVCSFFYDCRYRQQLGEPIYSRELMAQRFENTLRKVISFFFYKKQAGMTPSYNALVNRWEKLWFPKDMTAYDLAVEQHETWHGNWASLSNAGTLALLKFHEDFNEDLSTPLLIEERYVVPLTQTIRLEGCLDLVLRHGNDYRVILLSGKQKRPSLGSLLFDFAAMRYAFHYRNDQARQVTFHLYDAGSAKPGFSRVNPSRHDIHALFYWAQEAAGAEVYAPRRGHTSYCKGCQFDAPCLAYKFPAPESLT